MRRKTKIYGLKQRLDIYMAIIYFIDDKNEIFIFKKNYKLFWNTQKSASNKLKWKKYISHKLEYRDYKIVVYYNDDCNFIL